MTTDVKVYDAEGTAFVLSDPDLSTLRDTLPGHAYEPVVLALLGPLLRQPEAVFADVGALYGYLTVWAARHASEATVVAFEPEASYVEVLRRNLALNNLTNVRVEQAALVDEEGTFDFTTKTIVPQVASTGPRRYLRALRRSLSPRSAPDGPLQPIVAAPSQSQVGLLPFLAATAVHPIRIHLRPRAVDRAHPVAGVTFDNWSARTGIRPNIVKIDVHGGEGMVLGGMKAALRDHVQHVLLELHTRDLLVKYDHETILRTLLSAGFDLFEVHGFRSSKGWLAPVPESVVSRVADQSTWSPIDLYFMKFFYARRSSDH